MKWTRHIIWVGMAVQIVLASFILTCSYVVVHMCGLWRCCYSVGESTTTWILEASQHHCSLAAMSCV